MLITCDGLKSNYRTMQYLSTEKGFKSVNHFKEISLLYHIRLQPEADLVLCMD
ncbi:hypothetical protein I79_003783 [Cricetulus griseus]|uniref:Uncharacterized protein n=1 Tax=Cricetulus griseus TaxID=10029 RepID=G3H0W3_CRIGR|nr:hypothetical protein I79_003783 [Cricetulus griseus]